MIPDFTFPDTLAKTLCEIWLPSHPNWLKLETFDITRQDEAIWLKQFGLKWPMCRDRRPEISWKPGQIWQILCLGGVKSGSLDFVRAQE